MFEVGKSRMIGLRYDKKFWQYVNPFSSNTGTSRTDGRTRVSTLTRDKNHFLAITQPVFSEILCEKAVFHRISVNGTDIGVPQNVRICFDFPDAVWVSASGAFRIISDTLVSVAVLCFFLFWRDCSATAGRIFTKSSPTDVFAVLFVNGGTPVKIHPPKLQIFIHQ